MKTLFTKAQDVWQGKDTAATALKTLLARVLTLGVNISTSILTARLLGPDGRGEQTAIVLGAGFLATILTFGVPSSLIYNVKRTPESKSRFLAVAFLINLVVGSVAAVISMFLMPQWLNKFSPEVVHYTRWLTLNSPLILIQFSCFAALDALEIFSVSNTARLLVHVSTLVMLVGFAITGTMTPYTAAFAYVFASVPLLIWVFSYVWRHYQPQWTKLGAAFRQLTSYGFRSYGIDLLQILSLQADQVFVVGLLPPKMVGMYVVAMNLARMMNVFQSSIVTILFPKMAAKSLGEVMLVTGQAARVTSLAMFLCGVAIAGFGPIVLPLLYGSKFIEAVSVLQILVLETVVSSTTLVLAQAFMALGRPGIVTLLQGVGIGLSVPLMILFIPRLGLVGAGLALLTSSCLRLGFILASFPFILKTAPPNLLITKADLVYVYHKLIRREA